MSAIAPFSARLISTWSLDRLYRVYPTKEYLFFIRIGGQGAVARAAAVQFGILGGMILGYFEKRASARLADGLRDLDAQDPHALIGRHKHDFRVGLVEVESSRIGPAARVGTHGPHVGRWVLTPRGRKPITLQLEKVEDMKAAIDGVAAVAGPRHQNVVVWNADSGRFVKQPA